jgi:hypothetical protein
MELPNGLGAIGTRPAMTHRDGRTVLAAYDEVEGSTGRRFSD